MNAWQKSKHNGVTYYHYAEEKVPYIYHDYNDGDELFIVVEEPHPDIDYTDPDTNGPPDEDGLVFEVFGTLASAQRYVEQQK
jgi:hypothetical protein